MPLLKDVNSFLEKAVSVSEIRTQKTLHKKERVKTKIWMELNDGESKECNEQLMKTTQQPLNYTEEPQELELAGKLELFTNTNQQEKQYTLFKTKKAKNSSFWRLDVFIKFSSTVGKVKKVSSAY